MSAIASFFLVPKAAVPVLKEAAVPKKRWFGGVKDRFHEVLSEVGREVVSYDYSGYLLAVVLPYLDEKHGIDLLSPEHDEFVRFLCESRGDSWQVFTADHNKRYSQILSVEDLSADELRTYYEEFNETTEPEIGEPMKEGVRVVLESLKFIDDDSIVLLNIG